MNENIQFVLNDKRNCRSNNIQDFFKNSKNRIYSNVVRFEGQLWFCILDEDGFAGVKVITVACYGNAAKTCYPIQQHEIGYENVTDWFWEEYKKDGILSFPEIWGTRLYKQNEP